MADEAAAPMLRASRSPPLPTVFVHRRPKRLTRFAHLCTRRSVALVAVLGALTLVLCALVAESELLGLSSLRLFTRPPCAPGAVNMSQVAYPSDDPFYSLLREMAPLPAPTFRRSHTPLCNAHNHDTSRYEYCLPISGRADDAHCGKADRMDLLARYQSPRELCHASVLHMLMVDVYEEIRVVGARPLLVFGTLLGAVRNASMIPFTEDVDIAYVNLTESRAAQLQEQLWEKGYHMFFFGVWRVCVAPTHPLAINLYDPGVSARAGFALPYVDLYKMERENSSLWNLQETKDGRRLPDAVVRPFGTAEINGVGYDTVGDPVNFLTHEYGDDFMVPHPRGE